MTGRNHRGDWAVATVLLALAAAAYWNGAILDPLQFRGFPDYVTQLGGAQRLLAGLPPYDPDLPVWKDVNLPPVTLLLLFAPFTSFTPAAGRLAYFWLNHAAFLAGLATVLRWLRPNAGHPAMLWAGALLAMALTFEPWHDSLRLGQQNGAAFFFLAVMLASLARGRDTLAGIALALALIGKPSSALLGLYLLLAGRWRAVLAAGLAGGVICLATLPWTGLDVWWFYLVEKAPRVLAGTPQQSNVALLALHARLFLPLEALGSFDDMPYLPAAQWMTRTAQLLGMAALWLVVRGQRRPSSLVVQLQFAFVLTLSLSLVGHAWQSYVTWLLLAFVPLASAPVWQKVAPRDWPWLGALAAGCYAALAVDDVALHKVIGATTPLAAVFASLPNVALLVLAFLLALLLRLHRQTGAVARRGFE